MPVRVLGETSILAGTGNGLTLRPMSEKPPDLLDAFARRPVGNDVPVGLEEVRQVVPPIRQQTGSDPRDLVEPLVRGVRPRGVRVHIHGDQGSTEGLVHAEPVDGGAQPWRDRRIEPDVQETADLRDTAHDGGWQAMRDGKLDRPREPTPESFGAETAAGPWLEGRREDLDRALGGQAGEQRLASRVEALPRHELAGKHEIVDPGATGREPPEDPLVKRVMDVGSGHALPVERGDKLGRTGDHEIQIGKRIRQIEGAANRLKGEAQPGDLVAESAHQIAIIGVEPLDLWPERASLGEENLAGPGAFGDIDPVLASPGSLEGLVVGHHREGLVPERFEGCGPGIGRSEGVPVVQITQAIEAERRRVRILPGEVVEVALVRVADAHQAHGR
jgi:hypothetical protein